MNLLIWLTISLYLLSCQSLITTVNGNAVIDTQPSSSSSSLWSSSNTSITLLHDTHQLDAVSVNQRTLSTPSTLSSSQSSRTLSVAAAVSSTPRQSLFSTDTSNDIAVVMPFAVSQTHLIIDNSLTWSRYLPCSPDDDPNNLGNVNARVTLWLYYDGHIDGHGDTRVHTQPTRGHNIGGFHGPLIRRTLEKWWSMLHHDVTRCFAGGLRFMSANLTAALMHPDGQCRMFYTAFNYFETYNHNHEQQHQQYNHLFWMEPDVLPIQSQWLTALALESRDNHACQRFWQRGSTSRCDPAYSDLAARLDYHINGMTLTTVLQPDLINYQ
jgi:hypothetical protein